MSNKSNLRSNVLRALLKEESITHPDPLLSYVLLDLAELYGTAAERLREKYDERRAGCAGDLDKIDKFLEASSKLEELGALLFETPPLEE